MMAHTETLQSNVRQLESQALEMHKLKSLMERDLEAERLMKEQKTKVAFHVQRRIKVCEPLENSIFLHTFFTQVINVNSEYNQTNELTIFIIFTLFNY